MNEVGAAPIAISDLPILSPKSYSGSIKLLKARSAKRFLSMIPSGIPVHPRRL